VLAIGVPEDESLGVSRCAYTNLRVHFGRDISIEDEAYEIAYLQPVTGRHPGTTIKQEFVPNNLCEKETERTGEGREVEGR
jgi:hypothetical protein